MFPAEDSFVETVLELRKVALGSGETVSEVCMQLGIGDTEFPLRSLVSSRPVRIAAGQGLLRRWASNQSKLSCTELIATDM